MKLDQARLVEVLTADYGYYTGPEPRSRVDTRLNPVAGDLVGAELQPGMRVLDVGCGDGATLLRHADRFGHGVGIDTDQSHLDLAIRARAERAVDNVEFRRLDVGDLRPDLWPEPFDLVLSERGPIDYGLRGVRAALRVLRPDGLIFTEVIGDLHQQEVREVFGGGPRFNQVITASDQVRVAMERSGVGVRIAADLVSKRTYPDIYEWLKFQCSIWAWAGGGSDALPAPDDPRLELFADRCAGPGGEIEITHHVVWVGGVKLADPPAYDP